MCDICLEARKVFIVKQLLYDKARILDTTHRL